MKLFAAFTNDKAGSGGLQSAVNVGAGSVPRRRDTEVSPTLFLRFQQRKQDPVTDRFPAGQQHCEPFASDSETASRRHTVFKSEQKFLVDVLLLFASLVEQTLTLHQRIVQLAVTWRDLRAVNDQFKNVDQRGVFHVLFSERHE